MEYLEMAVICILILAAAGLLATRIRKALRGGGCGCGCPNCTKKPRKLK